MIDLPDTHKCIATEARVCETHGSYSAQRLELIRKPKGYPKVGPAGLHQFLQPFWTKCPTCDGEIQREVNTRDQEIKGGVSLRDQIRASAHRAAGFPEGFAKATVWNWRYTFDQQRRVAEAVRAYCTQFDVAMAQGRCVILCGSKGTGKTHLAIGIAKHAMEKGGTSLYTTSMDLAGMIRATYGKAATETETQVINRLTACDVLVIDEVGRQTDTSYEREQLWRVLNRRHGDQRISVVVTNMAMPALTKFLGDAMIDRLRESGGVMCVFDWPSSRGQKARGEASTDDAR